jgi:hypothetical protein
MTILFHIFWHFLTKLPIQLQLFPLIWFFYPDNENETRWSTICIWYRYFGFWKWKWGYIKWSTIYIFEMDFLETGKED